MKPIEYMEYDKLSDDVLFLGQGMTLRMNVSLSNKSADAGTRYHFHREFQYDSKYGQMRSIKRSFTYYLTLEYNYNGIKASAMIFPQDMTLLKQKLEDASKWFSDGTYGSKDDKLVVKRRKGCILEGLLGQGYIMFEPVAIINENTGNQTPGIRITISNKSSFADIDVDRFYALYYTIENFNMYLSAQMLVNYLGRPDFGMNTYEMDNYVEPEKNDAITGGSENRKIEKRQKSFFEKMNDLNKE